MILSLQPPTTALHDSGRKGHVNQNVDFFSSTQKPLGRLYKDTRDRRGYVHNSSSCERSNYRKLIR